MIYYCSLTLKKVKSLPIAFAAHQGHVGLVDYLLERTGEEHLRNHLNLALIFASFAGHSSSAESLLDRGAEINAVYQNGATALMYAAIKDSEACVRLLLERGAEINAATQRGDTALLFAAQNGHEACVWLLLESGAAINAVDQQGFTALLCAAGKGHEACVRLLLESGAEINAADQGGATALMGAAAMGREACVRLLLDRGAEFNLEDRRGKTALDFAYTTIKPILLIPSVFATLEGSDWINADRQLFEAINLCAAVNPSPLMVSLDNVFKNRAKGCFKLSENGQSRLLYLFLMLEHRNKERWGINNADHGRDKSYAAMCRYIGEQFYAVHRDIVATSNQSGQAPLRSAIVFLSMAKQFFTLCDDQESKITTENLLVNALMDHMGSTVEIELNGSALERLITADPDAFMAAIDELRSHVSELCHELDVEDMGLSATLFVSEREFALQAKNKQQAQQLQSLRLSQAQRGMFSVKRPAEEHDETGEFEPTKKINKLG